MICVYLLAALVAVTTAVPAPGCVVDNWGEWSECRGTHVCNPEVPETKHMSDERKAEGKGRLAMKDLMRRKEEARRNRAECMSQGACPQFNMPPTEGPSACTDGFAGNYPCNNVDLLSFINFEDLGFGSDVPGSERPEGNDMWVWRDVENSEDYVLMGMTGGTSFVRVTDPENPEVLGVLPTATVSSTWRDMKVVNNYAYIGSEARDHGVQVFDLTQLRGLSDNKDNRFTATIYSLVGNSHNIVSNPANNRIFIVGATDSSNGYITCGGGGLHIVDVSDPANPTHAGCMSSDGYTHDAHCALYDGPDTRYTGQEICFSYNEDSFTIVDTSDASAPVMLSRVEYDGARYSHQGWSSEDFTLNFLDDELDEVYGTDKHTKTFIWDITDLTNPTVVDVFESSETSIDHNMYIKGDFIYQANYEAGLRVLQIDFTGSSVAEVAYFDAFPSSTEAEFFGTWSNYPWLDNNVVAISSIDYGLFMVRVNLPAAQEQRASGVPQGRMERFRNAIYGPKDAQCPSLVEVQNCTPQAC